jgi:hypothetical protein
MTDRLIVRHNETSASELWHTLAPDDVQQRLQTDLSGLKRRSKPAGASRITGQTGWPRRSDAARSYVC